MATDDTLYSTVQNTGSATVSVEVDRIGDAVSVPVTDWIHPAAMKDPESFMAAIQHPDGRRDTLAMPDERDREIIMLRAERDLWKGLHGDLIAKFSAPTPAPEPADGLAYDSQGRAFPAYSTHTHLLPDGPAVKSKPAPEHDPFRDFSGDPRRMGR